MISTAWSDRLQVPSPGPAPAGFRRFLPIGLGERGPARTRQSRAQAGSFGLSRLVPALGRANRNARRIFLVSGETLDAYHWCRGGSAPPFRFEANEEGLERFSLHVAELPTEPVHVLVDFVEEEFREDSLPRLIGPERRALVQARRKRFFRESHLGLLDSPGTGPERSAGGPNPVHRAHSAGKAHPLAGSDCAESDSAGGSPFAASVDGALAEPDSGRCFARARRDLAERGGTSSDAGRRRQG